MRQPFSGTAERIFLKLLPNDSGENGVSIAVPKWGLYCTAVALKRHERVNAFNLVRQCRPKV